MWSHLHSRVLASHLALLDLMDRAHVFNELMSGSLEYSSYLAQGGDWGGAISSWLGFDHSGSCKGIHINILSMRHPDGPKTKEEKD
jgi:hypothetical protein